jgi:NAD(P)-dependent dehydrogenase (short-subunit alcohol dehydrogenase family)
VNASRLNGQTCVVTGASSGIGREIALGLASAGGSVCAIGRRREALEELAEAGGPSRFAIYVADLTKDDEVASLTGELAAHSGSLDVLVHSAGTISLAGLERAAIDDFDRQYAINVRAPYLVTKKLLPALRRSKGQIVFINSSAGLAARSNAGQFAATQHALKAIADGLREEVNADGIRVLSVYPGRTSTLGKRRSMRSRASRTFPGGSCRRAMSPQWCLTLSHSREAPSSLTFRSARYASLMESESLGWPESLDRSNSTEVAGGTLGALQEREK